jgi:IS5 family transposase
MSIAHRCREQARSASVVVTAAFLGALKLLNEARESTERIIDDLCNQHSKLLKCKPRYDRGRARAAFLHVAKQKKPRRHNIKAAIHRQLDYLQRNLDAIDALITSGAMISGLKTH